MSRLDYVYGAVSIAERENWPLIGLSTTRRALNVLCKRYNDIDIQCLACFVCGQLRTTCAGYSSIHLDNPVNSEQDCFNTEIYWKSVQDLQKLEQTCPSTLLNNCSYQLWRKRYARNFGGDKPNPLSECQPCGGIYKKMSEDDRAKHISEWAVQCPMLPGVPHIFFCLFCVAMILLAFYA